MALIKYKNKNHKGKKMLYDQISKFQKCFDIEYRLVVTKMQRVKTRLVLFFQKNIMQRVHKKINLLENHFNILFMLKVSF